MSQHSGKKILVVEDDEVNLMIARHILGKEGFEVSTVNNGEEAIEIVQKELFDLILMDMQMPVMNGLDFLRSLRREEGGQDPVVVFCSTENDAELISEAVRSGADEFVMKPFDADIIQSKFAEAGLI